MAKYQADNYRYAGQVAVKNAQRMAVVNLGMSFVTAGSVYGTSGLTGMFSSGTTAATSSGSAVVPSSFSMPNYGNTGNFIV